VTDARTIVYRLRAIQDPSSQAQIKAFGKSIQDALNPKGSAGSKSDFGKMADGIKRTTSAASDLDRQMKRLNETYNRRISAEEAASKKSIAAIDQQIGAYRKLEEAAARAHDKEEQRVNRRHRQRQRSVAIQNRAQRSSLSGIPDYQGAGAVDRPGGMSDRDVEHSSHSHQRLTKEIRESARGVMELAHGFAYLGLAGTENTEKIFQGLLKVEGIMTALRGAGSLAKGGMIGLAGAGVIAGGAAAVATYQETSGRRYRNNNKLSSRYGQGRSQNTDDDAWGNGAAAVGGLMIHAHSAHGEEMARSRLADGTSMYVRNEGSFVAAARSRQEQNERQGDYDYTKYLRGRKGELSKARRESRNKAVSAGLEGHDVVSQANALAYSEGPGALHADIASQSGIHAATNAAVMSHESYRQIAMGNVATANTAAAMTNAHHVGEAARGQLASVGERRQALESAATGYRAVAGHADQKTDVGRDERGEALGKVAEMEREIANLNQEEMKIQKEAGEERIAAQRQVIEALQDEKTQRLEIAKAEQQRVKQGTMSFGMMERHDQARALKTHRTAQQAEALEASGDTEGAKNLRRGIRIEDAQRYAGLNTRESERFKEKFAKERSDAAGGGEIFNGGESARIIQDQQKRVQDINAQVNGQVNLVLDMKKDTDGIVKRLAGEIEINIKTWISEIVRELQRQLKLEIADLNSGTVDKATHDKAQAQLKKKG
jgi:hypothetical protein